MNGPLSNINAEGFAAASFHSWPETLDWDGYSGDYGPNFLGLTLGSASYLVEDPEIGMTAYGGIVTSATDDTVTMEPRDAIRRKVFVAPVGVLLEIDAGTIDEVTYSPQDGTISITVEQYESGPNTNFVMVWIESEGKGSNYTVVSSTVAVERGGWRVALMPISAIIRIAST